MLPRFTITWQAVTEKSAQYGNFARHGYLPKTLNVPRRSYFPKNPHKFTLRECVELFSGSHVEANLCPISAEYPPRWFNRCDKYEGKDTTLAMHLPKTITPYSALRIARLLNCYGIS